MLSKTLHYKSYEVLNLIGQEPRIFKVFQGWGSFTLEIILQKQIGVAHFKTLYKSTKSPQTFKTFSIFRI